MNLKLVHIIVILLVVYSSSAVNILVLEEIASPSHHGWFRSLINGLASKGYNVTVVAADQDVSSTNIHYIHMERVYEIFYTNDRSEEINFVELGDKNVFTQIQEYSKYSTDMCLGNLRSNGWKQLENYPDNFQFDLIIHDYILGGCLVSFANKFKNVPLIGMTAFNDNFRITSYVQSAIVPFLTPYPFYNHNPKTFFERTYNFLIHMADKISFYYFTIPKLRAMIKETSSFKDTPSTLELGSKSVIYMTNYEPSVDGIQQIPPNVIPVGGLQIKSPSSLPEDLKAIADGATNGLILFSLGTYVQNEMLGKERIVMILEAFRKLSKYTFIWKINLEKFPVSLPSNVAIRKWVPQNDILAHKNTKVFITHAGLMSTQEAIYHGVPMLGIPIFADQFINIRRSVDKGAAEVLYVKDLSTENLYMKLNDLLTQSKYRKQAKLASAAFKDQKETPLERALWWIDWVMRNPNANHFRSSDQNINFLQLESLDIIVFLVTAALLSVYTFVWCLKSILNCIFANKKSGYKKNKKE